MKQPLAQDLILAVIAPASLSTTELARRFDVAPAAMAVRMSQLASKALVKRHSTTGRWMPIVLKTKPVADVEAVAEQVRFAPKAIPQIVRALSTSAPLIERALLELEAAGRVKRIGRRSGERWARADWTAAGVRRVDAVQRRKAPAQQDAARTMLGDACFPNERTIVPPKAKPALAADGSSWWVPGAGADQPRAVFVDAAAERNKQGVTDPLWRRGTKVIIVGAGAADV